MKIAVLVKQVPGSESEIAINDNETWIDNSSATFVINPPDEYALEEALLIKEDVGEGEVVVFSMGPTRVEKVIRECLAKGADRGIHIDDTDDIEIDPLTIAKRFTQVFKENNFDLILSGIQSDDTGMGQTGILIGEMLSIPTATLVVETNIMDKSIRVKRELESGWFQWVQLPLPASITIQSGINNPRYPSLKGIMGAKKKEIEKILPTNSIKSTKYQKIEKLRLPQSSKKTEIIEGDTQLVADRIVEILKTEIKVF